MGGGILRTVGRTVGAGFGGVQEPFSTSASTSTHKPTSNLLSLPSSSSPSASSSLNLPVSATSTAPTWPSSSSYRFCSGDEWELNPVDGIEDEKRNGVFDKFAFGPVPSKIEVENALSALQQVLAPAAFSQLIEDTFRSNWDNDVADQIVYPTGLAGDLNKPRMLQPHGFKRVYDAFHLLLTDSSVQRMVLSLSSDKAVWDAVLNNQVVRDLKESLSADKLSYLSSSIASASSPLDARITQPKTLDQGRWRNPQDTSIHLPSYYYSSENNRRQSSDENPDVVTTILTWILDIARANIMEFIEKITKLVNEVFQPPGRENSITAATDPIEETLSSSLLLSVVVLIIVVITRSYHA